jgi:hypothetical protein
MACKHEGGTDNCVRGKWGECKAHVKIYYKAYREANRERISAQRKGFRETNRERVSKGHKASYQKHRDKRLERCKKYYEKNRAKKIDYAKAWRSRPENAVRCFKRGAALRGYSWELTDEQAQWLMAQPCAYCGQASAGGIDRAKNEYGYTALNSVPCCGICNMTKHSKTVKAFIVAVNAVARYCPEYPQFKRRWNNIRKKLTKLGEQQNAAVFMDVSRVRKTRRKVTDLEGGTGSSVVPLMRVADGSDTRSASVV